MTPYLLEIDQFIDEMTWCLGFASEQCGAGVLGRKYGCSKTGQVVEAIHVHRNSPSIF